MKRNKILKVGHAKLYERSEPVWISGTRIITLAGVPLLDGSLSHSF